MAKLVQHDSHRKEVNDHSSTLGEVVDMDRRDRVGTNSCDGNTHDGVLFVDACAPFAIDDGNLF